MITRHHFNNMAYMNTRHLTNSMSYNDYIISVEQICFYRYLYMLRIHTDTDTGLKFLTDTNTSLNIHTNTDAVNFTNITNSNTTTCSVSIN